jgi:hypothetical protein
MRRIIGILSIALALVVGNLTLASATASGSSSEDPRTRTLRLVTKLVDEERVDVAPEGDSLGDQFVLTSDLFRDGQRVGEGHVVCTLTRLVERVSATLQCLGTLVLPAGQITIQGAPTFTDGPSTFTLAITGGTGEYRTAHGQVRVRQVSPTEDRLTVQLIL